MFALHSWIAGKGPSSQLRYQHYLHALETRFVSIQLCFRTYLKPIYLESPTQLPVEKIWSAGKYNKASTNSCSSTQYNGYAFSCSQSLAKVIKLASITIIVTSRLELLLSYSKLIKKLLFSHTHSTPLSLCRSVSTSRSSANSIF
jgi:hypothetical protein